ncbi:MAG: hypothetical protein A2633_06125 [Candidatus Sungbacteria bacterium RIFCSPHIGHO2_01_FULL_47_32]|uniref:Uncharacterized protein n=1 Tax=Candidatus Sungbacteria bacterium RIFCSPHIGHO2_01_FULL_47_32 TaxID=1802264 RepID=A0A1G2K9Q1_9BACT|nr:MAG: hypothetical protein UX72_C0001G0077 [Parcubacteria group bacterium GW2011_GWA2_47_10]OGZ95271.1 MAG: hypothetical protein A2633_06125 [Candidatus Sungbacteria bacterium RIFCSPHIGHO2_01_FULL_47_32]
MNWTRSYQGGFFVCLQKIADVLNCFCKFFEKGRPMEVLVFAPGDRIYGFSPMAIESYDTKKMVLGRNSDGLKITIEVAENNNSLDNDQFPPRIKMTMEYHDVRGREMIDLSYGRMLDLAQYGKLNTIIIFEELANRTSTVQSFPPHPLGPPLTRPINLESKPSGS